MDQAEKDACLALLAQALAILDRSDARIASVGGALVATAMANLHDSEESQWPSTPPRS